jgi:hypothetical protein
MLQVLLLLLHRWLGQQRLMLQQLLLLLLWGGCWLLCWHWNVESHLPTRKTSYQC